MEFLQQLKGEFDERIASLQLDNPMMQILKTAPGMNGQVLGFIVLAEIDNIHRFRNSDALVAYAGLVARDKSSGDQQRKGRLRSASNHYLQWAMIEAAIPAIRKDLSLRDYYKKVKAAGHHGSTAKVAVARRLLRSIYHMLKEQRPYYQSVNRG